MALALTFVVAAGCGGPHGVSIPDARQEDAGGAGDAAPDARAPGDAAPADAAPDDAPPCSDPCPAPGGGVTWGCEKRFMYGVNYAWLHFAGDFGGIAAWGQGGVTAETATHAQNLQDMRAHGASVIRWWVFPDFRGDGIIFDVSDSPTALGPTVVADVNEALRLADEAGVFLMLTIFSFDNFGPSETIQGVWTPGLRPMLRDGSKRTALLQNVVRPLARAVHQSAHSHRMIAWDVINEPEWAITGPSPYGDEDYTPTAGLEAVTHVEMESFIGEVIGVLRAESTALVSVGAAAVKWVNAWKLLDTDFHHFHIYKWINDWWPYTLSPAQLTLTDKPLVMGELPMDQLDTGVPYSMVLNSWWGNGYAGAMGWQYVEATAAELDNVKNFADMHLCVTSYSLAHTARPPAARGPGAAAPVVRPSLRRCSRDADGRPVCAPVP